MLRSMSRLLADSLQEPLKVNKNWRDTARYENGASGWDAASEIPVISGCYWVAGGPGFEPRLTESESAVLPLNYPPPKPL